MQRYVKKEEIYVLQHEAEGLVGNVVKTFEISQLAGNARYIKKNQYYGL
jgi:hypothetical protein